MSLSWAHRYVNTFLTLHFSIKSCTKLYRRSYTTIKSHTCIIQHIQGETLYLAAKLMNSDLLFLFPFFSLLVALELDSTHFLLISSPSSARGAWCYPQALSVIGPGIVAMCGCREGSVCTAPVITNTRLHITTVAKENSVTTHVHM